MNHVAILPAAVGGQAVQADSPREPPIMRSIHTSRRGGTKSESILGSAPRMLSLFQIARIPCLAATIVAYALACHTPDAVAQEAAQPAAPAHRGPTDPAELAAFVDGVMEAHMRDKHIAGATFIYVVDNKPFFAKGYGYADVKAKKPVSPDETMFRVGSVSKLLTWTAVMQLAEQGKVDLDADVNTYLTDFKIPKTYPQPITLKHLLTHTPGFEDHFIGLFARDEKYDLLGEILARDLPSRVRPAGELASYSNHGTALAGHIVALVSGMPWEDYIEEKILKPLEMHHTSVRQPAADKLPPEMSKGYKWGKGQFDEQGFEYVPAAPAGAVSSSAADMARFMIAHLQDGQYGSVRILKEETARQMRELLFTHDPTLAGMAYGFFLTPYNGEQVVQHGGDTFWFHSYFVMLPERKSGFFVSYNTQTGGGMREKLFEALLERYYPATDPPLEKSPPAKSPADLHDTLSRYEGSYGAIRHSYTSLAKLGALLAVAEIEADGDQLVLTGHDDSRRFEETEPRIFREIDGELTLAFREDASGQITHLFVSNSPAVALERLPLAETPLFHLSLLAACLTIFLSALLVWPAIAFVTREARRAAPAPTRGPARASCLAWLACLLMVAIVGLSMIPFADPEELAFGIPKLLKGLLWCTPIVALLVAAMFFWTLVAWKNHYWRLTGRLHYTAVLLAGIAFVWFLYHWNLLWLGA
jgi:CubicO group peptidase (beta-lactamase class C family)